MTKTIDNKVEVFIGNESIRVVETGVVDEEYVNEIRAWSKRTYKTLSNFTEKMESIDPERIKGKFSGYFTFRPGQKLVEINL